MLPQVYIMIIDIERFELSALFLRRIRTMSNYEKPIVLANSELSEGVYAASGTYGGSDCYTPNAYITQTPDTGRENYCIQVNGSHAAGDGGHTTDSQTLVMTFNQPVEYVSSNGSNVRLSPDGCTLYIDYTYHSNSSDNIGLGDVYVKSAGEGLAVTGTELVCNHN